MALEGLRSRAVTSRSVPHFGYRPPISRCACKYMHSQRPSWPTRSDQPREADFTNAAGFRPGYARKTISRVWASGIALEIVCGGPERVGLSRQPSPRRTTGWYGGELMEIVHVTCWPEIEVEFEVEVVPSAEGSSCEPQVQSIAVRVPRRLIEAAEARGISPSMLANVLDLLADGWRQDVQVEALDEWERRRGGSSA